MTILVDYDNLEADAKRLGISFIVNSIVSKIVPLEVADGNRITIRLYGGWYENTRFTIRAQELSIEINQKFPTTALLSDGDSKVIVRCEIAYSLLSDPGNHLFHTYRPRGVPEGLKANHPGHKNCTNNRCPIVETYKFVTNQICSQCSITPKEIFYKGEQKLVDTMLTSDLIFSSNSTKNLCIVSSDDDFWPGIITTLRSGSTVIHLHTKNGASTPLIYSRTAGKSYFERHI